MVQIFLDFKGGESENEAGHYKVEYERATYKDCKNFEKLKVSIRYDRIFKWIDRESFRVYIHEFYEKTEIISYYPQRGDIAIILIEAYFSNLHREQPLVLGFKTKDKSWVQYYKYKDLRGSWYFNLPSKSFKEIELLNRLKEINKEIYNELNFKIGSGHNGLVKKLSENEGKPLFVGEQKRFKKVVYIPNLDKRSGGSIKGPWELYSDNLLNNGKIDDYYLSSVNGKTCHYVCVYYTLPNESPLLLEFIIDCNDNQLFVRKDKNGTYWARDEVNYKDENELENKLEIFERSANANDILVFILDKKDNYNNVYVSTKLNSPETGFTKYTHKPSNGNKKSSVLYKRQKLNDKELSTIKEIETQTYVEIGVYYSIKLDIPLFVELKKSNGPNGSNYYFHKRSEKGSYWDKLEETERQIDRNWLKNRLKQIQFDLTDSIVILLDKQSNYGEIEIQTAIGGKQINRTKGKNLKVRQFLSLPLSFPQGYKVYEHDFSNCIESTKNYCLRLYISNNEITTYYDQSTNNIDYIYHDSRSNKLYVYFNKDNNTKPLMSCYSNLAYQPKDQDTYYSKWIKCSNFTYTYCTGVNSKFKNIFEKIFLLITENNLSSVETTLSMSGNSKQQTRSIGLQDQRDQQRGTDGHNHSNVLDRNPGDRGNSSTYRGGSSPSTTTDPAPNESTQSSDNIPFIAGGAGAGGGAIVLGGSGFGLYKCYVKDRLKM